MLLRRWEGILETLNFLSQYAERHNFSSFFLKFDAQALLTYRSNRSDDPKKSSG